MGRDLVFTVAGYVDDPYVALGCRVEIDGIDADAVATHHLQVECAVEYRRADRRVLVQERVGPLDGVDQVLVGVAASAPITSASTGSRTSRSISRSEKL